MKLSLALSMLVFMVFLTPAAEAQECSLDVFGLVVKDSIIIGNIKNTGSENESINFQISVGSLFSSKGSLQLEPQESQAVRRNFTFPVGEHKVLLTAEAACGAKDSEQIIHVVLQDFTCKSPRGVEGQNFCDLNSKEYLECSSGVWRVLDKGGLQYQANCNTCGDNVCNNGETAQSCPQDCSCRPGFVNDFQCSGDISQQLFRFADCSTEWKDAQFCSSGCDDSVGRCASRCEEKWINDFQCHNDVREQRFQSWDDERSECDRDWVALEICDAGCSRGLCVEDQDFQPTNCDITLTELDFLNNLEQGDRAYVKATIRNDGRRGEIDVSFSLDGKHQGTQTFKLSQGEETKTFFFFPGEGNHLGEISAEHSCGTTDSETFDVTVKKREKPFFFSFPQEPVEPIDTVVTILPPSLDIAMNTGGIVTLDITSKKPQNFKISVEGLPDGMATFDETVFVESQRKAFVYVTPKEPGNYVLTVSAKALSEGSGFSRKIDLFVPTTLSLEGQEVPEIPVFLIAGIMVAAVLTGLAGYGFKKRRESYWNRLMKVSKFSKTNIKRQL